MPGTNRLDPLGHRPRCPHCGGGAVSLIAYGLPTEEMAETAAEAGIVLGGCCIADGRPSFVCEVCDHSW
jgi:hypothetical protein